MKKKIIKIGEYLCSHFDIEDARKYVTFLAYDDLLFQERKKHNWNAKKKKDLHCVWRRCCDWLKVSKVVFEVSCWRFLVDNAPQSSRPIELNSDQIETLIEINQHYTMREVANILKISKSMRLLVITFLNELFLSLV